jgi:glycosyltransferase involved in cell wall biosynthesis
MQKSISIVIPVHNEEKNIPLVYRAVKSVMDQVSTYTHEIIFVNDGSTDGSQVEIDALRTEDATVRGIEFTRNFGKEIATTAGIREAVGDAVICLDADLQHPPALIPEFITHWEHGAEVVVGMRSSNSGEGFVKRYGSKLFYTIMSRISETEMTAGETDFRLIDRSVADVFSTLNERGRMTRSLINWLGFRKETVSFAAPARLHGQAQYSFPKLVRLALNSFASNSLFPLRVAGYLGLFITGFSFLLGLTVFFERYVFGDSLNWHISGSAQLAIINVFLIGIVLMALGIIAIYIGRINEEVSNRPLYVVRTSRK